MAKDSKSSKGVGKTVFLIIFAVLALSALYFGVNMYQNYQKEQQIKQEKITLEKKRKRDEIHFDQQAKEQIKKTKDTVPVATAKRNVSKALSFGFKAISSTDSESGQDINLENLSDSFKSDLNSVFKTTDALQDLNDAINISTDNGEVVHGDREVQTSKAPKVGTKYIIDDAVISQNSETDSQDDNYHFDVVLKYHPRNFSKLTVDLDVVVDSFSGKISSIEETSIK